MAVLRAVWKGPRVTRTLYASGALHALHRQRNRHRLTVVGFHRVLERHDPRFATSDPEYTLPADVFAACLPFFTRHYNVVSLPDVLAARRGQQPLPERPLLLTFDDGWSDNAEYALPLLRRARLPAVIFVAGAVLDRARPFWQEQLIAAWRSGRLDGPGATRLWQAAGGVGALAPDPDPLGPVRRVIAALERIATDARERLLGGIAHVLAGEPRSMITTAQLRTLASGGFAIGAHGYSHAPLTTVDASKELTATRAALRYRLGTEGDVPALSFPHGRYDDATVAKARDLGYELLFTSVRELTSTHAKGPGLIGRVCFTEESVTDKRGRFSPDRLALRMFRAAHAA